MSRFKTHIEIEVEIEYDYQPFEPQTKTDPECPADIENMCVSIVGIPIEKKLDKSTLESIKQQCFENEATNYDRSF